MWRSTSAARRAYALITVVALLLFLLILPEGFAGKKKGV